MTMFEGLQVIGDDWRAIVHVSEWSGLSIGMLAALAALVYFDPKLLKLAIVAAICVLLSWFCLVHGHATGVADEDAKLQAISTQNDTRAATAATQDETARVSAIESQAEKQHDTDLQTIARLTAAADCGFDPGTDDGGVRDNAGQATDTSSVSGNAQPASGPIAPAQSAAGPASRHGLHLPLVSRRWLPWKKPISNAAANGK